MAPSTRSHSRVDTEALAERPRIGLDENDGPSTGTENPTPPEIGETAPGIPEEARIATAATEPDQGTEIERLREIAFLHGQVAEARRREAEALAQVIGRNRHRNGRDSSEESEPIQRGEIQRTVPVFHEKFTVEKRDSWLRDLNALFKGAPRKFISDSQMVLAATGYLSADNKKKWDAHVRSKPQDEDNWTAFEEWTKDLLQNSYNITTHILLQLEELQMQPYQDPNLFESQLAALENHLPEQTEEQKAQIFFRKLWKPLRDHIITNTNGKLPQDRASMLYQASLLFGVHFTSNKRKNDNPDVPNKHRRGNHTDSTPNRYQKNRTQTDAPQATGSNDSRGRGGKKMRGRFNTRGRGIRGRGKTPASGVNSTPANNATPTNSKGNHAESASDNSCFICGDPNHWSPDCPSKATIQAFGRTMRKSRQLVSGKVEELN